MCGIAGIVSYASSVSISSAELTAFTEALAHRGPDGSGIWLTEDRKVGLAHRRLAIVDLFEGAAQPMHDADEKIHITFNGEIYNHISLRAELEALGHRFRSHHSDTEVLIYGYIEWGIDGLVKKLNGMFAFALWDERAKRMLLVRDRVGIKPIYFTRAAGRFIFASEIKALFTDQAVSRAMNGAAITHYLSFMVTPAPLTLFRGIFKLPAAHILEVEIDGTAKARRYWDAVPNQSRISPEFRAFSEHEQLDYLSGETLRLLETAVCRRMMTDVPSGVFLSGGLDSSAITALTSKNSNTPVKTFSVGYSDNTHLNELSQARLVAEQFQTDHHEVLINERDMRNYIAELIVTHDEPIADWVSIPLFYLSKLAKNCGVSTVQTGEGADEQFAGYPVYMKYLKMAQLMRKQSPRAMIGSLSPLFGLMAKALPGRGSKFEQAHEISLRARANHQPFYGASNAFWHIHMQQFVNMDMIPSNPDDLDIGVEGLSLDGADKPDSGNVIDSFARAIVAADGSVDELAKMIHAEFRLRLPELLLMRSDKITMSNSLEARVPFLDHELVEFSMSIDQKLKIGNGDPKHLLKRALKDMLPDEIIHRKKMGFAAPVAELLRSDFGYEAQSQILGSRIVKTGIFVPEAISKAFDEHRTGRQDNSLNLWVLFNLTAWHDHWIEAPNV